MKIKMKKADLIQRAQKAGHASKGIPRGESSRKNGRHGGRPADPDIKRIMKERGVSRQRAHQIVKARVAK